MLARLAIIAAVLTTLAFLAPHADASELGQHHGGQVTINVTPSHGQPFGFRAPIHVGGRFINGCFRFCGPAVLGVPFLPPPAFAPVAVPVAVPVAAPVAVPVAQPVAVPVAVPQPVQYAPQYAPALPVSAPCGCPTP